MTIAYVDAELPSVSHNFPSPFLQDHEFIPTRMKTIQASRPVGNPQQFTRLPSNPLLESAQRQMELAEEVKRQKEMARRNSERQDDP